MFSGHGLAASAGPESFLQGNQVLANRNIILAAYVEKKSL
jgi:hypothetical protein